MYALIHNRIGRGLEILSVFLQGLCESSEMLPVGATDSYEATRRDGMLATSAKSNVRESWSQNSSMLLHWQQNGDFVLARIWRSVNPDRQSLNYDQRWVALTRRLRLNKASLLHMNETIQRFKCSLATLSTPSSFFVRHPPPTR